MVAGASCWWRKKKKKICRIETEGPMMAVLSLVRRWVGRDDGGQAGGEYGSGQRPRRTEKREINNKLQKLGVRV